MNVCKMEMDTEEAQNVNENLESKRMAVGQPLHMDKTCTPENLSDVRPVASEFWGRPPGMKLTQKNQWKVPFIPWDRPYNHTGLSSTQSTSAAMTQQESSFFHSTNECRKECYHMTVITLRYPISKLDLRCERHWSTIWPTAPSYMLDMKLDYKTTKSDKRPKWQ